MARKNQTAVSDEEIIAALLNAGTISQAAENLNISPRTIYDRMGIRDFKAAYSAAKSDIVRSAVLEMNRSLSGAVVVIAGIMNDEKNNPAIRLQAAKMILDNASKFAERLREEDRRTAEYAESPFSVDVLKW